MQRCSGCLVLGNLLVLLALGELPFPGDLDLVQNPALLQEESDALLASMIRQAVDPADVCKFSSLIQPAALKLPCAEWTQPLLWCSSDAWASLAFGWLGLAWC